MKRAFTLIELLVVVAIIIALLAILLPSLNRAVSHAQLAACQSNLHQVGMATLSYTADYFGVYPSRQWQTDTTTGGTSSFATLGKNGGSNAFFSTGDNNIARRELNTYLGGPFKDDDEVPVARCPVDTDGVDQGFYESNGSSYRINSHHENGGKTLYTSHRIAEVRSQSRFVLYHEAQASGVYANPAGTSAMGYWHRPFPESFFTLAFADGHAGLVEILTNTPSAPEYTFHIDK